MTEAENLTTDSLQELTELLRQAAEQATFDVSGRTYPVPEFRSLYQQSMGLDSLTVSNATPQPNDDLLSKLMQCLRSLLGQYIVDDNIGHIVKGVVASAGFPVSSFALDLVRAASILGPERVTGLLWGWVNGKPFPYRMYAVLSGVSVDHPLEICGGVRFENAPEAPNVVPDRLAFPNIQPLPSTVAMRTVIVTIECEMKPALYRPEGHSPSLEHSSAYGPVSELLLDALCEALSLACNDHVGWRVMWPEYGDLKAFGRSGTSSIGRLLPDDASILRRTEMSQQQVQEARPLFIKRMADRNTQKGLDMPISRWRASKWRTSFVDQFIELRIALEALYLGGTHGELGFRLANYGAWHLGADFDERRQHQEVLRRVYGLASNAVHADEVKETEETRELLTAGQDLCRRGILKRLYEAKEPNWNEMILGKEF